MIRRLQNICFLPGVLEEVLEVLKRKVETMEDVEKDCVLFMDEMEISQGFDHDRSLDCRFRNTTLPASSVDVANRALVLWLVGKTRGRNRSLPTTLLGGQSIVAF